MASATNGNGWQKWALTIVTGLLMFFVGHFVSNITTESHAEREVEEHAKLAGHPVLEQRVKALETKIQLQLDEISRRLERIEKKLE